MTLPKGYKPSGEKIKSYKDHLKLIGLIVAIGSIVAFGTLIGLLLDR